MADPSFLLFRLFKLTLALRLPVLLIYILIFLGCDNSTGPEDGLLPLPDDTAVYLSMEGTEAGLWILNPNSLELIDSMITAPGVPWTIEFSPDYNTWYSCWGRGIDKSIYSCNLQPLTIKQSVHLQYAGYALAKNYDGSYLIAYGHKGIDIFDRESLSLIYQDTTFMFESRAGFASSHTGNRVYFVFVENHEFIGIGVFSLDSMKVSETLRLFNSIDYPGLAGVDLVISPDDKYLFLSAYNWPGGFGSFFIIDLIKKRIVDEFRVGALSQLAISPDGKSVYISDPGGYLYMLPSSGKVWRYDVKNNSMEVLINNLYYSDRITVSDDNRSLFITPFTAFDLNGKQAWLVKVNALNGNIIKYYSVIYDSTGYFTNLPRNVKMGKYKIQNNLPYVQFTLFNQNL